MPMGTEPHHLVLISSTQVSLVRTTDKSLSYPLKGSWECIITTRNHWTLVHMFKELQKHLMKVHYFFLSGKLASQEAL